MFIQTPQAQAQSLSSVLQGKWGQKFRAVHQSLEKPRPQGTGDMVLSAGQPGVDENPDAGGKEGGRTKKSVLLWLPAAANKSFQSLFWKLTLLGDLQDSLQHTQQMELQLLLMKKLQIFFSGTDDFKTDFKRFYISAQGPSEILSRSIPNQQWFYWELRRK